MTPIRAHFMILVLASSLLVSCTGPERSCTSDDDCASGEYCLKAGGVFFSGGKCVANNLSADTSSGVDVLADTGPAPDTKTDAGCVPTSETCNGKDDNCDGIVDERCPCHYKGKQYGVCVNTSTDPMSGECLKPAEYVESTDNESPKCDAKDNDCDGEIDEGCGCNTGDMRTCYTGRAGTAGVGQCTKGTQQCENGTWGSCDGEVTPDQEMCGDSTDSDCDGATDNGCPCNYMNKATGVCANQTLDQTDSCQRPLTYESQESSCTDGRDNDCDGATDGADTTCTSQIGATCTQNSDCASGQCVSLPSGTMECAHRLFVTSSATDGSFSGVNGADTACGNAANRASLSGNWYAIISDKSTDASSHVSIKGPVVNMNGDLLATGASDLWDGTLDAPVQLDETGSTVSAKIWTGSLKDGRKDGAGGTGNGNYCGPSWNNNNSVKRGEVGDATASDAKWLNAGSESCDRSLHLYCIDGQ